MSISQNTNQQHRQDTSGKTPNDRSQYDVTTADLPLHCPLPSMSLWNSHPKVYLPIEATGSAKCPYCGAEFTLLSGG